MIKAGFGNSSDRPKKAEFAGLASKETNVAMLRQLMQRSAVGDPLRRIIELRETERTNSERNGPLIAKEMEKLRRGLNELVGAFQGHKPGLENSVELIVQASLEAKRELDSREKK